MSIRDRVAIVSLGRSPDPLLEEVIGAEGCELIHHSSIADLASAAETDPYFGAVLLIGPDTWREYFKPRLAKVINLAREESPELLVFYHCDGNFTRLIPDLMDIGVNVINPVQPDCMDARALKLQYGDRLAMWGTVGTAWMWDMGSPEQIRAEVQHRIETLGPDGLLMAPAYDIDFTPLENIIAFVEAVETFGRV